MIVKAEKMYKDCAVSLSPHIPECSQWCLLAMGTSILIRYWGGREGVIHVGEAVSYRIRDNYK